MTTNALLAHRHHSFTVRSRQEQDLVEIRAEVQNIVLQTGLRDGLVHLTAPSSQAAVVLADGANPDVGADLMHFLGRLFPRHDPAYRNRWDPSPPHLKAIVLGAAKTIAVRSCRLMLGDQQSVFLADFAGPSAREVWVTVLGA